MWTISSVHDTITKLMNDYLTSSRIVAHEKVFLSMSISPRTPMVVSTKKDINLMLTFKYLTTLCHPHCSLVCIVTIKVHVKFQQLTF